MNMYKRPPLRVREASGKTREPINVPEGSFLYDIIHRTPITRPTYIKRPIYQKADYLALLKKNYEDFGLDYVEPEIPDYVPVEKPQPHKEPTIYFIDHVQLKYKILKSGIIRIKLDISFPTLYEKYYKHCKQPSMKLVIQAYESMGFSEEFIDNIKKSYTKKASYQAKIADMIERIFEKEPVKKPKKKTKDDEVKLDDEIIEEEEEKEEDVAEEDEGLDIEVDEDPEEQSQEEEYFSDGGD